MKKLLAILLLLLAFAPSTFGATYYASKISGTWRYKVSAWPEAGDSACSANDIEGCLSSIGSNELVLSGGPAGVTYDPADMDTDKRVALTANDQILRGPTSGDPDLSTHGGAVTFDHTGGTEGPFFSNAKTGWAVKYIRFVNVPVSTAIVASGTGEVYGCYFYNNINNIQLAAVNTDVVTIRGCLFDGLSTSGPGQGVYIRDTSTGTGIFVDNIFRPKSSPLSSTTGFGGDVRIDGTGTYKFYNNVFVGSSAAAINIDATPPASGTTEISNNLFLGGNASVGSGSPTIDLPPGHNTTVTKNWISHHYRLRTVYPINGADTDSGNIFTGYPGYTSSARKGYILFTVDDFRDTTWEYLYGSDGTDGLVAEFVSRGLVLTWFVDMWRAAQEEDYATKILWVKNQGMEIGLHTYSHTALALTSAMTVTSTATNPQIDIDRATHKIILTSTEDGVIAIPAAGNFEDSSLGSLISAIDSEPRWTATKSTGNLSDNAKGEILLDSEGAQSVGGGYTILLDKTTGEIPASGFFKAELLDPLNALEAIVGEGYVKSFAYPYGSYDDTAKEAVRLLKGGQITSARSVSQASIRLNALDRYITPSLIHSDVYDDSSAGDQSLDIQTNITALCAWASEMGMMMSILAHAADELSVSQWAIALSAAKPWQGKVGMGSTQSALSEILAESTDNGDGTVSRVWGDTSDYRLTAQSILIDGGGLPPGMENVYLLDPHQSTLTPWHPVAATDDVGAREIGAFVYQPQTSRHGAKMMMGF